MFCRKWAYTVKTAPLQKHFQRSKFWEQICEKGRKRYICGFELFNKSIAWKSNFFKQNCEKEDSDFGCTQIIIPVSEIVFTKVLFGNVLEIHLFQPVRKNACAQITDFLN